MGVFCTCIGTVVGTFGLIQVVDYVSAVTWITGMEWNCMYKITSSTSLTTQDQAQFKIYKKGGTKRVSLRHHDQASVEISDLIAIV